jgi:hypothetical protein
MADQVRGGDGLAARTRFTAARNSLICVRSMTPPNTTGVKLIVAAVSGLLNADAVSYTSTLATLKMQVVLRFLRASFNEVPPLQENGASHAPFAQPFPT